MCGKEKSSFELLYLNTYSLHILEMKGKYQIKMINLILILYLELLLLIFRPHMLEMVCTSFKSNTRI
jgi:hypothetical protein